MLIIHGTSSKKYSQPAQTCQTTHLCQSLMPPKKPSVHNLANPSSGHPQFSTMINYCHACCEQHRCLAYSSSTQQGTSQMRQFFFCPHLRHLVTAVRLSFWLEYKNGKNVLCGGVAFVKTPWALRLASTTRRGDQFCIIFYSRSKKTEKQEKEEN